MPYHLTDEHILRLKQMRADIDGLLRQSAQQAERSDPRDVHRRTIWAKTDNRTQDGSNKRWKYDFSQVEKTSTGYGGWTAVSGGITGTNAEGTAAYNQFEDQNGSSGVYGNGVDSANLSGTIDIQPIPNGTRVKIEFVPVNSSSSTPTFEAWIIGYANGVDGECG